MLNTLGVCVRACLCIRCIFVFCLLHKCKYIHRIILSQWLDTNFAMFVYGGLCRSCTWIDYYCNAVLLAGFWQLAKDPRENDKQIVNYFDEIHTKIPLTLSLAHTMRRIVCIVESMPETKQAEKKLTTTDWTNNKKHAKCIKCFCIWMISKHPTGFEQL